MVRSRTAQANQIRGLFAEFGLVMPQGIANLYKQVPALLEEVKDELPGMLRELVLRLLTHFKELDRQVGEMEVQIQAWHRSNALSRKLEKIPGIGPLTASALVASIGDAKSFENGRQLAAWLGLVPKQHSSGGKQTLLGISKRGDCYLRTLLIYGARAVTLEIRAIEVTDNATGDDPMLPCLLNQISEDESIASVSDDGAYETKLCHEAVAQRGAQAIIPTRKNAKPWKVGRPGAKARNAILAATRRLGRKIWKKWAGYHRRSLVKTKMRCFKLLGETVMARDVDREVAEL